MVRTVGPRGDLVVVNRRDNSPSGCLKPGSYASRATEKINCCTCHSFII